MPFAPSGPLSQPVHSVSRLPFQIAYRFAGYMDMPGFRRILQLRKTISQSSRIVSRLVDVLRRLDAPERQTRRVKQNRRAPSLLRNYGLPLLNLGCSNPRGGSSSASFANGNSPSARSRVADYAFQETIQ